MALRGSDVEIGTDNWTVTCTWDDIWLCWYQEMLTGTSHRMRLDDFRVKSNVSAYLFNGFGITEADRQLAPQNGTDNWTVTCTWDDMWRSQYSRMLISTNHCLRFENLEVKVSVSAQLFNGFGITEADRQLAPQNWTDKWTVTCTSDLDREGTVTCTWNRVNGTSLVSRLYTCDSQ